MDLELVRLTTAGSVDDGKSTLIGRLLFDCNAIFQDQLEAIKKASVGSGQDVDLSLITDGLSAEREQKITIDVAYRYFTTKKRRFIISDVPGHEQYTRNMVTGASTADVAMILVDARKGVLTQTRRHLFVASLLNIPHIMIVVNKIDEMNYDQKVFERIKKDIIECSARLQIEDLQMIPISALKGDMVVHRGEKLDWYQGSTLYDYLENVQIMGDKNLIDFRFPVQSVFRPHQDFRGYAGKVEGGIVRVGDEVTILPSGKKSKVASIIYDQAEQQEAFSPQSIVMTLEDERDISRGEMIVRSGNLPEISKQVEATVCWFSEEPMQKEKRYLIKHTTRLVPGSIDTLRYRLNIDTFHREKANVLKMNEIGRVYMTTHQPLIFDPYYKNRHTGGFIIIDEATNATVGAGMIVDAVKGAAAKYTTQAQKGALIAVTGKNKKQTEEIAEKVYKKLRAIKSDAAYVTDLYSPTKNHSKKHLTDIVVLTDMLIQKDLLLVAPVNAATVSARAMITEKVKRCVEIAIDAKNEKNTKTYQPPKKAAVHIDTKEQSVAEAVDSVIAYLQKKKYIQ